MIERRMRPRVTPVTELAAAPVPELKPIAMKIVRNSVVECPTDQDLMTEILKSTPRPKRMQRRDGYTHVSDLIGKGKCIRRITLADKLGVPLRMARLTAFDRIVFAVGDTIHDTIKKIATEGQPGNVWGKWKCSCGHLYHDEPCLQSDVDQEEVCELCNTTAGYYREVSIFNEEYKIVGNPDLLLYLAQVDAFHVCEIKSMAEKQWEELARPLPEHVLQVVFYWWLMMMAGYKLSDRVSIIYITKGYQFKGSPYKEFMVDPTRELARLVPYLEDARLAKLSADHEMYPTRKMCSGEYTTQAKKCEVCGPCFSLP